MVSLNDFNWEVNLFVKYLTSYQNNVNKVNNTTMELLGSILQKVDEFIADAEVDQNDSQQFFQIDESHFEFGHFITCRICHLQIGITHEEYINHASGDGHHHRLIAHNNELHRIIQTGDIGRAHVPIFPSKALNLTSKPEVASLPGHQNVNGSQGDRSRAVNRTEIHSKPRSECNFPNQRHTNPNAFGGNNKHQRSTSGQRDNRVRNYNGQRRSFPGNHSDNESNSGLNHNNNTNNNNNGGYKKNNPQQHNHRNNGGSGYNNYKNIPQKAEPDLPVELPNVFDDNIYSFIDQQSSARSNPQNHSGHQSNARNPPQRRNSESATGAPTSSGAEIKPVPPYMLNSLYQQSRYNNPSAPSQRPQTPQNVGNRVNSGLAKSSSNAQVNDDKLLSLLESLKAKRNSNSTTNLSTVGRNESGGGTGSLSGSRLNISTMDNADSRPRSASMSDESKGAVPKRLNKPNTQQNATNSRTSTEIFKEFFIRDISPIVCHLMHEGTRLRDQPSYKKITDDIQNSVREHFPNVQCHLFGSRMAGIANDRSNLDIYVDLLNSFNTSKSLNVLMDAAEKVERALDKSADWSNVFHEKSSRIMMSITAIHESTKIHCKITLGIFGTGVSVHTARLINSLYELQPVCRQTTIWIRNWFKELPSKQMETFNGYLIILLVIFFFQVKNKLPSVKDMQDGCVKVRCGENSVEFRPPKSYPIWSERFRNILIEFFEYYSKFKFDEDIISVFEGQEVNHSIRKQNDADLSNSLSRFKSFVIQFEKAWRQTKMGVQDIFVHQFNVSDLIHPADVLRFQAYCKESIAILRSPAAESVKY